MIRCRSSNILHAAAIPRDTSNLDGGWFFLFLPLPSYRKHDQAQKKKNDFYIEIIRKRKETGDSVSIHTFLPVLEPH